MVRRKDLPTSVEKHLIEPGVLDPAWKDRIQTLWEAWDAEVNWHPGRGDDKPTIEDAAQWAETARKYCKLAHEAITAAGVEVKPADTL